MCLCTRHYRRLSGREFEHALGVGDGQGRLACCSPWGRKELDTTEQLNWTELTRHYFQSSPQHHIQETPFPKRLWSDLNRKESCVKPVCLCKAHLRDLHVPLKWLKTLLSLTDKLVFLKRNELHFTYRKPQREGPGRWNSLEPGQVMSSLCGCGCSLALMMGEQLRSRIMATSGWACLERSPSLPGSLMNSAAGRQWFIGLLPH